MPAAHDITQVLRGQRHGNAALRQAVYDSGASNEEASAFVAQHGGSWSRKYAHENQETDHEHAARIIYGAWQGGDVKGRALSEALQNALEDPEAPTLLRSTLRQVYQTTRQSLTDMGVHELRVFRGLRLEGVPRHDYPATAWTLDKNTAQAYANETSHLGTSTVLERVVPAAEVLALPSTGLGSAFSQEVVVLRPDVARQLGRTAKEEIVVEPI